MSKSFKTPKGTELPLMDLKGKPYLQVAHRLVWFREEMPDASIITTLHEITDERAVVRANIVTAPSFGVTVDGPDDERNFPAQTIATATKVEHRSHFADYVEKAETGAIGRALALCGFGTQFAPELDEMDRIVDSPMQPARRARGKSASGSSASEQATTSSAPAPPARERTQSAPRMTPEEAVLLMEQSGWENLGDTQDNRQRAMQDFMGTLEESVGLHARSGLCLKTSEEGRSERRDIVAALLGLAPAECSASTLTYAQWRVAEQRLRATFTPQAA